MSPSLAMPLWLERPNGGNVPLYVLRFDASGVCLSPQTQQDLLNALRNGDFTHVCLFSHGWNNTWPFALDRYQGFFREYVAFAAGLRGPVPAETGRPLLVGVFWPSIILTSSGDNPPVIAAADPRHPDPQRYLDELARVLPAEDVRRLGELARRESEFTQEDALEAAGLLAPIYADLEDEAFGPDPETPALQDIVASWKRVARAEAAQASPPGGQGGFADEGAAASSTAAAWSDYLNPITFLRYATVYQMKDRAGRVGRGGVGRLMRWLLEAGSDRRFHLIGHSYGCKVLLSALCGDPLPRGSGIESLLLIEPAINYRCFAVEARPGRPGAYRDAFTRVRQPILTTHTKNDWPLSAIFHLFVRRSSDLGELEAAAADMTCGQKVAPNLYAALGGYGPGGCAPGECVAFTMTKDQPYVFPAGGKVRIAALNGDNALKEHNDFHNDYVYWALNQQLARVFL